MRNIPKGSSILVAMSGGVDSSVVAYRLKKVGFEIIGVTMRLVRDEDRPVSGSQASDDRACCSIAAAENARRVATDLGITHYVLNLADLFSEKVIDPTRDEYRIGRTPNPCILCNRYLKFDVLFNRAEQLGCTHVATGHYSRIHHDSSGYHLLRGIDPVKDQSYFLAFLTENELERIIFPIGDETKDSIRHEAASIGLIVADRPDSQDLCFFTAGVEIEHGVETPGKITLTDGTIVGSHDGIECFTRGQRKGIPGGMEQRMYVVDIDPETNRVIIGTEDECFASRFAVEDVSLVSWERDREIFAGDAGIQVRYRTRPIKGRINLDENRTGSVELAEPVRAITPGQAAVFYKDENVVGAGVISSVDLQQQ